MQCEALTTIEGSLHHPFHNRTIPSLALSHLAFCWFCIRTITFAFRRGVGLPLPLHQSLLFPLIFAKEHLSLALLAPPVAPNTVTLTTIAKPHYPSKSTISLPPLSKVRCCRPKEFGRLPEGLPHRYPSPRTIPSTTSPLNFSLFIILYSFPPCIPLTTSADNSIIKAVTSISI